MTSEVIYVGELRTEARHIRSGKTIVTDAPIDNQGKGEAFSPTDLAATSIAACILTIMGIRARKLDIDIVGSRAEVTKEMASHPRRIARITIDIFIEGEITDLNHRESLEEVCSTCPLCIDDGSTEQIIHVHW